MIVTLIEYFPDDDINFIFLGQYKEYTIFRVQKPI